MSSIYLEHSHHTDDALGLIETYVEASRQKYPKHFGILFQQQMTNPFFQMDEATKLSRAMRRADDHHLITAYLDDSKRDIVGFVSSQVNAKLRHDTHEIGMLCSVSHCNGRDLRNEKIDNRLFAEAMAHTPKDVRVMVTTAHAENKAFLENCGMMHAHSPGGSNNVPARPAHRIVFGEQVDLMAMVMPFDRVHKQTPSTMHKPGCSL